MRERSVRHFPPALLPTGLDAIPARLRGGRLSQPCPVSSEEHWRAGALRPFFVSALRAMPVRPTNGRGPLAIVLLIASSPLVRPPRRPVVTFTSLVPPAPRPCCVVPTLLRCLPVSSASPVPPVASGAGVSGFVRLQGRIGSLSALPKGAATLCGPWVMPRGISGPSPAFPARTFPASVPWVLRCMIPPRHRVGTTGGEGRLDRLHPLGEGAFSGHRHCSGHTPPRLWTSC